jgi:hypothetical protein
MTVSLSPGSARIGSQVRFGVLLALGVLIGHDAVYGARYGVGSGFAAAMTALGHDAWWLPFGLAVVVAAFGLIAGSVHTVLTLRSRLQRAKACSGRRPGAPIARSPRTTSTKPYLAELRGLWPRLFAGVILVFAVQENIETFAARGEVPGVDVLLGSGFPVSLLVLGIVTGILAALGSLIRWRIRELREQLRLALARPHPRPRPARPAREWAAIDALAPHRWVLVRRDAGRAPPRSLFA